MTASVLGLFSILVRLAFAIPVLILLLNLYSRTRMSSFLWLAASLVAWPLLAFGLSTIVPMYAAQIAATRGLSMHSTVSIITSVYLVEAVIGGSLLLLSIFLLSRDLQARMQTAPPVPLPPAL